MRFLVDANMAGSTVRPQFNLTDRADTTTAVQEESRQQNHFGSKTDSSASLIAMAYWLFRPHSTMGFWMFRQQAPEYQRP